MYKIAALWGVFLCNFDFHKWKSERWTTVEGYDPSFSIEDYPSSSRCIRDNCCASKGGPQFFDEDD